MTLQSVEPLDEESWPGDVPREGLEAQVEALIAELLDSADLDRLPSLVPLVQDVLFMDTVTRIFGPSGSMKSFLVLDLAGAIGTGQGWHGKTVQQGTVLYLVAEGAQGIGKRKRAWEQHYGRKMTGVCFLPRPVQTMGPEWNVLIEACRRLEPVLIIIDTQARVTVGVKENDNTEMGKVVDRMEALRAATGACVLVVHHTGHEATERSRGASAVLGAMQTEIGISRQGKGLESTVTMKIGKQKDDEELRDHVFAPLQIKLTGEAREDGTPLTSVVLVPATPESAEQPEGDTKLSPAARWVLEVLEHSTSPLTVSQIGDIQAGQQTETSRRPLKRRTIQAALKTLDELGKASEVDEWAGSPRWSATGPETSAPHVS